MAETDEAPDYTSLLSFLQQEEQNAIDTELNDRRASNIRQYYGEPYGDEVIGRSQLVTRDIAETVDYMIPSILRTLLSGDRIVQFEAKDQADTQAVDDASELIHYNFMREQNGFRICHDWLKTGLLEITGGIKTWVQPRTEKVTLDVPEEAIEGDDATGLTVEGQRVLAAEIIAGGDVTIDPVTLMEVANPATYRVTVERSLPPLFLDASMPSEEFQVSSDARDLPNAVYQAHITVMSLSDLRQMGFKFDNDILWGSDTDARVIADARDSQRSKKDYDDQRQGAMRRVWLREEYVLFDLNEDGIAERLLVHRVGTTILNVTEIDEEPFEEWCPFPAANRRVGQSLACKVADIQRVRTVMLRQGMDSLYLSTNPRTLIHEDSIGENTIDDMLTVRSGAAFRWTGQVPPAPWATLPVHEQAFTAMEYMVTERESRTGITRMNQGLDAEAFNKGVTATQAAIQSAQGQQQEEYVGRQFVEAVGRLFAKKYRLMRKYGQPVTIQVGGEFRTIDPRTWPEEFEVRCRVGLGTGRKDQRLQYAMTLLETQIEGIQSGSPLVTWDNAYNTSKLIVSDMGLGNVSDFITQPKEGGQPQQSPPDPALVKAQTEQGKTAAEEQRKTQKQEADLASDAETRAVKFEIMREDAAAQRQLQRDKAVEELRLANERQQFEMAQAVQRQAFDEEMARRKGNYVSDTDGVPSYRPGGDLSL